MPVKWYRPAKRGSLDRTIGVGSRWRRAAMKFGRPTTWVQ